jgi:hypothetical protein
VFGVRADRGFTRYLLNDKQFLDEGGIEMLPVLLSSLRALEAIFHHVGNAPTPAADAQSSLLKAVGDLMRSDIEAGR